jgi:two-component system response regulator DesR
MSGETRVLRVLLAEDMHMVRGALVTLLAAEPDLDVVAEVAAGDEVLAAALAVRPDIAVIDYDLPGCDGIGAAVELHEHLPACGTIILTGIGRPGLLRRAMRAGVTGFVRKDAPPRQLAEAIRTVAAGGQVLDPELAAEALRLAPCPLTPRELEVLRDFGTGAGPREIAAALHLSLGTVRNYLTAIEMKLDARNRVDAVRIAREADWI